VSVTRIEVKDLVVRYGDQVAVNGVSFTVDRGEHLTLLGPSGCGKTTTLRAIAGLEQPSGGSIGIDGQTMYDSTERKNVQTEQRGVSMVFQSYAIWPHMSVFDNVAYGLRVRKQSKADIKTNVERALDLVQMRHLAERGASKLSGGQQQSRSPISTPSCAPRCGSSCASCSGGWASPRSTSRTTRRRRSPSPTASL
jgi:ABC-type Fe3+/spermidine/putrescine transport system ATPase subunit